MTKKTVDGWTDMVVSEGLLQAKLQGAQDLEMVSALCEELSRRFSQGCIHVVLDMTEVAEITREALILLVGFARGLSMPRRIVLIGVTAEVHESITANYADFEENIGIFATVDEALQALSFDV